MSVFPDAEAVVIHALGEAEIEATAALPTNPDYPCVVVKRVGGLPVEKHHLDNPNIQIEVWGTSKAEAQDLAQQARSAIHEIEGTLYSTPIAAFVSGVEDTLGLSWSPDPVTNQARYVFAVGLYIVPNDN